MDNKISIQKTVQDMNSVFQKSNDLSKTSQIPWIITKVLRITMAQYHMVKAINESEYEKCLKACDRVVKGETVADIFGVLEFYNQYFDVVRDVFYPRSTTETLIDSVREYYKRNKGELSVLDLCSGTGCISITISKLLGARTLGVDISPAAINIAKNNSEKLNAAKSKFAIMDIFGNWKDTIGERYDMIVSNPPYWTFSKFEQNKEKIRNNPINAFVAGETGLEFYEEIIKKSVEFLKPEGMIFLEIDSSQTSKVKKLLNKYYCKIKVVKDYLGENRVVYGKLISN